VATLLIVSVNINLVMADIVYKQGQQFDSQGNWVSSVELYRRALATRKTEDHYMLFLGRALLEQAKQAPVEGAATLPPTLTLDDVLALTPDVVAQLGRTDLLRAAEAVLLDAQQVNPLNTDHTANLARLYRTWADLVADDPTERAARLDQSLNMYETAVTLSPNAAHLWNERGNAYLALGDNDNAMAAYEKSLSLDQLYDQTYLLMADFLDRTGQTEALTDLLNQAVATFTGRNDGMAVQMLSYLSVVQARAGDLAAASATNEQILALAPGNATALRNLAVIARDQGDLEAALVWAQQGIAANAGNVAEVKPLYQVAAEVYQLQGNLPEAIVTYEQLRQIDPNDTATLQVLLNFYMQQGEDARVVEIAQTLSTLEPTNFLHPWQAAQALIRLNRPQDALPYAQQALTLATPEQQPAIDALIQQISGG
jgi:tetratricopeptide (TPR) repeat protein